LETVEAVPSRPRGGEVVVGGSVEEPSFLVLAGEHLDAARSAAREALDEAGLRAGQVLLLLGTLSDSAIMRPFGQAAAELGCPYFAGDPSRFTRPPLLEFFRQLRPGVVLGLGTEVESAIHEAGGTVASVFTGATIFATPAVAARLGPGARQWIELGHVVAAGCAAGRPHLVTGAFRPVLAGGRLGLVPETGPGDSLDTGVRGWLEEGPCSCGLASPRFLPVAAATGGAS
jgi:hypothetical protein